jgi:cell division protein FtsI (penicillin-binding protein 3)
MAEPSSRGANRGIRQQFPRFFAAVGRLPKLRPRARVYLFVLLGFGWLGAVVLRLWELQVREAARYFAMAAVQHEGEIALRATRGAIYDRMGEPLAVSTWVDSIFALTPEERDLGDVEMKAGMLAPILHVDTRTLEQKINKRSFQWIKRLAEPGESARVRDLNLPGIHFEKESKRYYPNGEIAAHILGAVGIDHAGQAGLENSHEELLRGKPGRQLVRFDAMRNSYESRTVEKPVAGSSLVLTIDKRIQSAAEAELARAVSESQAKAGTVVVLEPRTGDVLAMANWPTFDPNERITVSGKQAVLDELARRSNFAVSHLIEPGSSFKIVTVAAALEEKLTHPDEVIDCQNGAIYIGRRRIRDHKPYGLLSVSEIIARSSNVGAIKLGLRLEPERLHRYIRKFGYGDKTGIPLPGEIGGLVRPPKQWRPASIGSISIGQEIGVTALQLARAVSAIANGGMLVRPRLVQSVIDPNGQETPVPVDPPVRAISASTAADMRLMMEQTILNGTARMARIAGYRAGGKTGTAQIIDPLTGAYSRSKYLSNFVAFAPFNDPRIVVVIAIDSPVGHYYGGLVAAPVFARLAPRALRYRDVAPEESIPSAPVPKEIPIELLADFASDDPALDGESGPLRNAGMTMAAVGVPREAVWRPEPAGIDRLIVDPPAPEMAPRPSAQLHPVALRVTDRLMPDLRGRGVRDVLGATQSLGLHLDLLGNGIVRRQSPPPGTPVVRGESVRVELGRTAPGASKAK